MAFSHADELQLPHRKLRELKHLLASWASKWVATKRELQVLLGHLNHTATVVPAGKPFLRHLINAMSGLNIATKELLPHALIIGAAIWGMSWQGYRVKFFSDNQAAVHVLGFHSAKDPHLLRSLFFLQAHFRFKVSPHYIPGKNNRAADAPSRNKLTDFFFKSVEASIPRYQKLGSLH